MTIMVLRFMEHLACLLVLLTECVSNDHMQYL